MLNPVSEPSEPLQVVAPNPRQWRKRVVVLLLITLVGVLLVPMLRPTRPRAERLPIPANWPTRQLSFADRIKRLVPMWGWRLRDNLRGPLREVLLEFSILNLPKDFESSTAALPLGSPALKDTNGLAIWIMGTNDLSGVMKQFLRLPGVEMLGRPRIQTSHGVEAGLYIGSTFSGGGTPINLGLSLNTTPLIRGEAIDLTTMFCYTEAITNLTALANAATSSPTVSVETNGPVATRIQMAQGNGVLMMYEAQTNGHGRRFAVLLRPTLLPKK